MVPNPLRGHCISMLSESPTEGLLRGGRLKIMTGREWLEWSDWNGVTGMEWQEWYQQHGNNVFDTIPFQPLLRACPPQWSCNQPPVDLVFLLFNCVEKTMLNSFMFVNLRMFRLYLKKITYPCSLFEGLWGLAWEPVKQSSGGVG